MGQIYLTPIWCHWATASITCTSRNKSRHINFSLEFIHLPCRTVQGNMWSLCADLCGRICGQQHRHQWQLNTIIQANNLRRLEMENRIKFRNRLSSSFYLLQILKCFFFLIQWEIYVCIWPFNSLRLRQMAAISQKEVLNSISCMNIWGNFEISSKSALNGPADN